MIKELIVKLREKTGAGIMDCKEALMATNDNVEDAILYLRKKGSVDREKRAVKQATEGTIGVYIHAGEKVCAIVEVNSETDFVARSPEFKQFAHDLAMHVTAAYPKWVNRSEVPAEVLEKEKEVIMSDEVIKSKPPAIAEKIVAGKLNKFYKDVCLMEQSYVKEPTISVQDLLNDLSVKIKEKIVIKRFVRFAVGEGK